MAVDITGIQMERKELTKIFMMISKGKNIWSLSLYKKNYSTHYYQIICIRFEVGIMPAVQFAREQVNATRMDIWGVNPLTAGAAYILDFIFY